MIEEPRIRKWHRIVGVALAPLIFLQALSGMVISFEILSGIHNDIADLLHKQETHSLHYAWEYLFLEIHYGGGHWGTVYHFVIALGLTWSILTGVIVFFKVRKRQREMGPNKAL